MTLALNRQISWLVMLLFAIGALATLYLLFGLSNDLALQAGVLSSEEIERAQPFVFRVQVVMAVTLAAGFFGLLILSRQTRVQEVYVERMRQKEKTNEAERQADEEKAIKEAWIDDLLVKGKAGDELYNKVFERVCKKSDAVAGAFYTKDKNQYVLTQHYALAVGESQKFSYEVGEGLVGQAAKSQQKMVVNDVPENSMRVVSGLGESRPKHLVIIPLVVGGKTVAVSEIGLFNEPEKGTIRSLEDAHKKLGEFLVPAEPRKTKSAAKKPKSTES